MPPKIDTIPLEMHLLCPNCRRRYRNTLEYRRQRDLLIPYAEDYAYTNCPRVKAGNYDYDAWNRLYFSEMTRLSIKAGLLP